MNDVVDYMFSHQVLYYVEYLSLQRYKKVRAILKNPMKFQSPPLLPSAVGFGNSTITCSTDASIPPSGGGLPKDAEACPRRILSNPMKRQSRLHCDQIEYDETQEPSSVPSAISLGNPSIPCSVSLSGGASDVRMAQPTVQKHRIPCML